MKKSIMPIIAIVLLVNVNKTFAQASQKATATNIEVAQPPQLSPQQRQTEVATRMSKTLESKLSLTADQYNKVYEATLNYVQEIDAHKSGTPLTKETHNQYVAEKNAKIKNVLTAAQYSNYVTMSKVHGSTSPNN